LTHPDVNSQTMEWRGLSWEPCLTLESVDVLVHKLSRVGARFDLAPASWEGLKMAK
jgi:hypothetical protein